MAHDHALLGDLPAGRAVWVAGRIGDGLGTRAASAPTFRLLAGGQKIAAARPDSGDSASHPAVAALFALRYARDLLIPVEGLSPSPVAADGKIYITNEDGLTTVIAAGPKFEILAENPLNDYCLSSPAISDGNIFIRTGQYLYRIGKKSV